MTDKQEDDSFVPFYGTGVVIHMGLKISKDGKSREEDTLVLRGMYGDEQSSRRKGWGVRRRLFGGGDNNDSGDTEPVEQ